MRAEPALTISIDFYPSPAGNPGRKEKEDRQVRTLWNVIRGAAPALGAQPSLNEMEAGTLPPEAISSPDPILDPGANQGTGFEVSPCPSGEGQGRAERSGVGGVGWKTQALPSPAAQPRYEMAVGPQACRSAALDLPGLQMTQSGVQKSKERGKKCFKRIKAGGRCKGFPLLRAQHMAGPEKLPIGFDKPTPELCVPGGHAAPTQPTPWQRAPGSVCSKVVQRKIQWSGKVM